MSVGYGGRGVGGKGSGAHLSASTTPKAFAAMISAHVALAGDLGHVRRQDARAAVGAPDSAADGGPVAPGHGLCVDLPRQPARGDDPVLVRPVSETSPVSETNLCGADSAVLIILAGVRLWLGSAALRWGPPLGLWLAAPPLRFK